jgi:small subunit ribosomal protein S8
MSQTDPIADMLTRLRNANKALHAQVDMPASAQKIELARVLRDEGYVSGYSVVRDGSFDKLVIELKYTDGRRRVISQVKRVSKPGRRIYAKKDNLPRVLGGLGTAVISTSRGLMTAREAQRLGVGGEVVCFVW